MGFPGLALNIYAYTYDNALAHELGHNFGASHASYMTGGTRGAVAYNDNEGSWVEYGNPYSTMGQGDFEDAEPYGSLAPFLSSTKMIFDWIDDNQVLGLCGSSSTRVERVFSNFETTSRESASSDFGI